MVKTVFSTTEITAMVSGDWNDDAMATFAHLVELKARKENKNDMLFLGLNVIKEGTDPGRKLHGKLPADKSVTRGCGFLKDETLGDLWLYLNLDTATNTVNVTASGK